MFIFRDICIYYIYKAYILYIITHCIYTLNGHIAWNKNHYEINTEDTYLYLI